MAENYFVKCEDCGRRLPGPARTCDVCGGKMTRSAEESYYTPEGIIKKRHYRDSARKTPDRDDKPTRKPAAQPNKKFGSKKKTVNDRTVKTGRNKKRFIRNIIGVILFAVLIISFFANIPDKGDSSYNYLNPDNYMEINVAYPGDIKTGEGYSLEVDDIRYINDPGSIDVCLTVNTTGTRDISFTPYESFGMEFDGRPGGEIQSIYMSDWSYKVDDSYYSKKDTVTLEPGTEYSFDIVFDDVPDWNKITFIHDFNGDLSDRNKNTDVTVYKSEFQLE